MVGQFDHLLPTLRLICGVLGRKSIPWLPVLPSRRVVHKRLVLNQIPTLWKVKCLGEREEMDSHLENFGLFIWAPYLNSLEWRYGSCLFFASVFFKGRWPILHEDRVIGREHCLDRPFVMDRLAVEILGFVVRGIVWRRWISIPGVGNWHARHFEASKTMGTQRRKICRWQVPSSNRLTIRQSSK